VFAEVVKEMLLSVLDDEVMRAVKDFRNGNRFVAGRGAVEEAGDQSRVEDEILNDEVGAVVVSFCLTSE